MSYLGLPRLHFAGRMQTDVATVNNVSPYHDNNLFEPRYQRTQNGTDYNGLWNPRGTGAFRIRGCRVTSLLGADGVLVTDPRADPLAGAHLAEDNLRVSAKIVDLGPSAQNVPQIYGLRLRLLDGTGAEFLRADMAMATVDELWRRQEVTSGRADPGAAYQSVLTDLVWSPDVDSPFLRELRETTEDGLLSIKFNVDGVDLDPGNATGVAFGRIVGSIGAHRAGEPHHFVAGRRLRARPGGRLNQAPCRVDEAAGTVFVDLGNAYPTTSRGGPVADLGPLRLAVLGTDGTPAFLVPLDGLTGDFYPLRAAIASARLTPGQVEATRTARLAVVDAANPPRTLLAENADASMLRLDNAVFRLHPGTPDSARTATLYGFRYGRPAAGLELLVAGGQKPEPLEYPDRLTTGPDGRAEFRISTEGAPNQRPYIDGATFSGPYGRHDDPAQQEGVMGVRVFENYRIPDRPTWVRDVQPIFQQYANLYPAMRDVLDMGDYDDVVRYKNVLRSSLLLPVDSPNHMPVTRDLSPRKRDMIVKWLDTTPAPPVLEITTPDELRAALQQALLVEQAVIPPYLAALFSIKAGRNTEIAAIISGVVREEMLHMALVANILNAVGGTPVIGRPGLVPTYPGRLPGPVLPGLQVRLRACSPEQVENVFMAIEAPDHPTVDGELFTGAVIDPATVRVERSGTVLDVAGDAADKLESWFARAEYQPMTIGWFYNRIARAIIRLDRELAEGGEKLFSGDPARQVSWPDAPGTLFRVTDRRSALLAVHEIIEQGEGSPLDLDGDAEPDRLGHYYRFKEIVEGRKLVHVKGKWVYEGAPIKFDPDGVHPVVDDADTYRLAAGSVVRRESELCDEMYTKVLDSLEQVFTGRPETLPDAMGLMYSLQIQAKKLYDLPTAPGAATVAGPAFQSPGVVLG